MYRGCHAPRVARPWKTLLAKNWQMSIPLLYVVRGRLSRILENNANDSKKRESFEARETQNTLVVRGASFDNKIKRIIRDTKVLKVAQPFSELLLQFSQYIVTINFPWFCKKQNLVSLSSVPSDVDLINSWKMLHPEAFPNEIIIMKNLCNSEETDYRYNCTIS